MGRWWVVAWVEQPAPNVVGARKIKAWIFYTMNPLLYEKRPLCVLGPSLGEGFGGNVYTLFRLIGTPVVDFLLVIIELFPLGVMVEALRANINCKSPFLKGWVTLA